MQHLILINGLPGSGKTTISRLLCEKLKPAAWIDTDDLMHMKPWSSQEQRFSETLRRGLLLVQDFFDSGIPTVIMAGCVHSQELFEQVRKSLDLTTIQCTAIALQATPEIRRARQEARGKTVDVGTDSFVQTQEEVQPATLIIIDSTETTAEETVRAVMETLN